MSWRLTIPVFALLASHAFCATPTDWWSFQPLKPVPTPKGQPIDAFIQMRLANTNLKPNPPATPRALVRRLHYDLTGLPPRPEVVRAFERAPTEAAYLKLVDALLASPAYGERWARHWLDVARYGESNGFEYNEPRRNAWPYRDWVINALNAGLPYDQFARMQLAGDVLQPGAAGTAAVGFLVAGMHNTVLPASTVLKRQARADELGEMMGVMSQAFLGLSIHCARCHDHKTDPISTDEYYAFAAAFSGVHHGERTLTKTDTAPAERAKLQQQKVKLRARLTGMITARGGLDSKTANQVRLKQSIAANALGKRYRVSFKIGPTVWAGANQATTGNDGVAVQVFRADGSRLASVAAQSDAWQEGKNANRLRAVQFEYTGDGRGDVRLHLRPVPMESGRFGGAVDDLAVTEVKSGKVVFAENFDKLKVRNKPGAQAHTGRAVHFGADSPRWEHWGTNTIHAEERAKGNFALQLFSGQPGGKVARAQTAGERALQVEIDALDTQLKKLPAPGKLKLFTAISKKPPVMRVHLRGNAGTLGNTVPPGAVSALRGMAADLKLTSTTPDAARRKAMAAWVTHRDNPLFARVMVNRVWHWHFGQGLVRTPSDFGANGARPSHPELLDWLATWFRENGYRLKPLHRLIVTSATYRQSAKARTDALRRDRDNQLLWRFTPRRIEGEALRDAMLFVSGTLNPMRGGPGFEDVKEIHFNAGRYYQPIPRAGPAFDRRTIYRFSPRGGRDALLDAFDCPDPSTATPARTITTTPLQALSLRHNPFVWRMAEALAKRVQAKPAAGLANLVDRIWWHCLGRSPDAAERKKAIALAQKHGLPALIRVLFNCGEFVVIE